MSLFASKKVHLVGIKGVAMTALAQCLSDLHITVTGSDVEEDFVTASMLRRFGFKIFDGFDPVHIPQDLDVVVYTGAHQGKQNPEVTRAVELGIPTMSHAAALAELMDTKKGISVCGTGGKSSTSAMIAWILEYAGFAPSYAIGVGNISNLNRTGRYDRGEWFVAEADEYAVDPTDDHRPRFIYQHPEVIVCTNLKYDHPDIYSSFDAMKKVFLDFFNSLPSGGKLIINGDDLELVKLCEQVHSGVKIMPVSGETNLYAKNAAYAMAATPVSTKVSQKALKDFRGTMRRFEYKGRYNGLSCYDDYAHTPDEIRATIQLLREKETNKKVIVAFQPHTYSRTKALFDGFVDALSLADEVIVLDIFPSAREQADPSMSSRMLADKVTSNKYQVANIDELARKLPEILRPGCVFITMGAGDIYKVYDKIRMTNIK